ncbi:MAG TPA: DUF2179 domain-containing protein [Prolixibacteraceae bacterium]|nr:DUF2179 domain-containing protein [Prolixibacteraceae bacterium]
MDFFQSEWFTYLLIPLMIFFARIADVTIGTLRIVMVAKGQKLIAPILGFFEVLIWLVAMSKIFENLDSWVCYIAYGGGFAMGNYIGLIIEEKLAYGIVQLQIITRRDAQDLIEKLKKMGYGITHTDAHGTMEDVSIIITIIKRAELNRVIKIIKEYNPKSFYSIADVRFVNNGLYVPVIPIHQRWRKGK